MSIYKMRTEFGHHLKWVMAILAVIFIIGAIFTFGSAPSNRENGRGGGNDEVVAKVAGMEITRGEVENTWNRTSEALRNQGIRSSLQFASEKARVFQSVVDTRMTLAMAQAMGVDINNREVQNKRDQMIEEYLKQNRRRVLGKVSSEQDRSDPRRDREYTSELSKVGTSISAMESQAEQMIPEGQIQFQLAQEGIQKAMADKAGKPSSDDVKNSYNVYSVREIVVPKSSMPEDQLKTRVNKIYDEAKSGDFAALAKKYSADQAKGGIQSVSFGSVSPEVWDEIAKLKAGEVSNPIETSDAVYVVKVENMASKLPAKFDKKTQEDRAKMVTTMREIQQYQKVDKDVRQKIIAQVVVTDPEYNGYWHLAQLQRPGAQTDFKKELSLAANSFKKAIAKNPNNQYATALLAVLLKEQGNTKEATVQLYHLLEGDNAKGEGADLRIMLADMLLQSGKKDEALKQYQKASEAAGVMDIATHEQLASKFKAVGRADLAASEAKTAADLLAKKKIFDAQQAKSGAPKGSPTP